MRWTTVAWRRCAMAGNALVWSGFLPILPKGACGHSRDQREDRPQVLLAVATATEGVPIHLEVLRGNRADTTTLRALLNTLKRRFGIQKAVFVFDNGMSSALNLETMRKEDLH